MLLPNHRHLDVDTPYAGTHALFVCPDVERARPADVIAGTDLVGALDLMLADTAVAFVDIHNAKQGCHAARVTPARARGFAFLSLAGRGAGIAGVALTPETCHDIITTGPPGSGRERI